MSLSVKNTFGGGGNPEGLYVWKKHNYIDVGVDIVPWAYGTDDQIAAMVNAADNGLIKLSDFWSVGDERKVTLSAMPATGVGESHAKQTVTFVLMNVGGKFLARDTPSGRSKCSFIVGLKNGLAEQGYMNSSDTNSGGWEACARRTWCNTVFRNAIPSTLRGIFKQHRNHTGNGTGTSFVTSTDYFALPAEKEVFGSNSSANSTAEANLRQFKYYQTDRNIIKKDGDSSLYSLISWWERSPSHISASYFSSVRFGTDTGSDSASTANLLAPFGCI